MIRIAPFLTVLLLLSPVPAEAKSYLAERFDAVIRLLAGGDIEVTETVVFRFESGTFGHVFREIPTRRTDGIRVLSASMDGRELPFGDHAGTVEVSHGSRVRVRWRFPPVSESAHEFELRYRVHGVVRQQDGADVLAWRALPSRHAYTIEESRIVFAVPTLLSGSPALDTHRVGDARIDRVGDEIVVDGRDIRRNGWIEATLRFPPASLTEAAPLWQQREDRADALAPRWVLGAGLVLVSGLVILLSIRQHYDAPRREATIPDRLPAPPAQQAPGIAGALAANGRSSLQHAMATLFSLADRGILTIAEEPKKTFGQRSFTVRRRPGGQPLAPHEEAAFGSAFTGARHAEDVVSLTKARNGVARHLRRFREAVRQEMVEAGLVSDDRRRIYERFGSTAAALFILGAAAMIAMAFLVRDYRGWPLLVAGAIVLLGVIALMFQAATTPLSNTGVRLRDEWRAYQRHLRAVARNEAHLSAESPAHVLPLAVALGLASAWAKYVKQHPAGIPDWFHASSPTSDGAFAAVIAAGGATSGGGAGGGAAGGGASGAG